MKFSQMSRGQFLGVMAAGIVFVVGAITVVQQVGKFTTRAAKTVLTATSSNSNPSSTSTGASGVNFAYLVPSQSADWTFDSTQIVFESDKGLVKYSVGLTNAKVSVTITQQSLPSKLRPKGSSEFEAFIAGAKPTRSTVAGLGTVYYLPALKNGSTANGSDTIVFATNDILMFGRSDSVLGYDAWAKLLAAMAPAPM